MVDTIRDKVNALLMDGALTREIPEYPVLHQLNAHRCYRHKAATTFYVGNTLPRRVDARGRHKENPSPATRSRKNVKKDAGKHGGTSHVSICLETLTRPTITSVQPPVLPRLYQEIDGSKTDLSMLSCSADGRHAQRK